MRKKKSLFTTENRIRLLLTRQRLAIALSLETENNKREKKKADSIGREALDGKRTTAKPALLKTERENPGSTNKKGLSEKKR